MADGQFLCIHWYDRFQESAKAIQADSHLQVLQMSVDGSKFQFHVVTEILTFSY